MDVTDFAYGTPEHAAAPAVGIFADRVHLRADLAEDAAAAGFRIGQIGGWAELRADDVPAGDALLIDCPEAGAAHLAALAALDQHAARAAVPLVVLTSLAALDGVFGCLDQSGAQILIEPNRGERVVALGQARLSAAGQRVHELSEVDRLALLRLTEQVGMIAERLDRLDFGASSSSPDPSNRVAAQRLGFLGAEADTSAPLVHHGAAPPPDPRLVRRILRQRQLRGRFFNPALFADPAWDMLLDLTAARAENARVSVSSLCIASGVPPTTALRWIGQMAQAGLFVRVEDPDDRRRAFVALSDRAAEAMAQYFAELGEHAAKAI